MNRNCILLCSDTTSNSLADGHSNSVNDTTMDEGGNHSGDNVIVLDDDNGEEVDKEISAAAKRRLTVGGRIINEHRSRLTSGMLEVLMCSQNWLRNKFKGNQIVHFIYSFN